MPLEHDDSRALRRRLERLLRDAQHNEMVHRRLQSLELRLIAAEGPGEMLEILLRDYPRAFRLSRVTLLLSNPGPALRRLLDQDGVGAGWAGRLIFADAPDAVRRVERLGSRPRLGPFEPVRHADFFPDEGHAPASIALLPMAANGRFLGTLNLGSRDPGRFRAGAASDFLARLAAVAAMCLENGVNRQLLRELGLTDALTQLRNRRYFDERLREELRRASRSRSWVGCLFMDLDRFKQLNDAYGHAVGDRVLARVARLIQAQLRASDVLARYGGEEFVALLPETGAEQTARIGERVRQAVGAEELALGSAPALRVTLSVGGAAGVPPEAGAAAPSALDPWGAALLQGADRALYQAKNGGRDRMVLLQSWGSPRGFSGAR